MFVVTGRLGIVDYDDVELGNLHRQILHSENGVGVNKASSAAASLNRLNSKVTCVTHHVLLDSSNAMAIIKEYDVIVDATDNVATRYLLNDACVLSEKPLVSGGALRFEGQLTTYHYQGGPCYRCLYPEPPPPDTVTNCSDGGVIGAVPGMIGCLQALEAVNIISRGQALFSQRLLMFDGCDGSFQNIRLRARQVHCKVCGDCPDITELIDYKQFCGANPTDKTEKIELVGEENSVTCTEYNKVKQMGVPHILLDVRDSVQYNICRLQGSYNAPLKDLAENTQAILNSAKNHAGLTQDGFPTIYTICRRGNDSQRAVQLLVSHLPTQVFHIHGGLEAWNREVDADFPVY